MMRSLKGSLPRKSDSLLRFALWAELLGWLLMPVFVGVRVLKEKPEAHP